MLLEVPSFPLVVAPHVFDAWAWVKSDVLEWRRPTGDDTGPLPLTKSIEGQNPPNLVFVMRDAALLKNAGLPVELAKLHAFGYGLGDHELALAPYAIDDATDLLYEHRARPHDIFWLAASTLDALVWGLHDWAHFHNHGPFDEPAMTELQCDLIAMAWLRINAPRVGLAEGQLKKIADDLARLSRTRFQEENATPPTSDLEALFAGPYPQRPI